MGGRHHIEPHEDPREFPPPDHSAPWGSHRTPRSPFRPLWVRLGSPQGAEGVLHSLQQEPG